jgi:hypothetical protein
LSKSASTPQDDRQRGRLCAVHGLDEPVLDPAVIDHEVVGLDHREQLVAGEVSEHSLLRVVRSLVSARGRRERAGFARLPKISRELRRQRSR